MSAPPVAPSPLHRPYAESAARVDLREVPANGARAHEFDVVSRGDFVPGRLDWPTSGDALPLALVLGGSDAWTAGTDRGLAIARIDLPLLGHRQSPKLTDRLRSGHDRLLRDLPLDADTRALVEEFARQSVSDVVRTLEALGAEAGIDASRTALIGVGLGASAAAWALPFAKGLTACAIAGPARALSDEGLDPVAPIAATDLGPLQVRLQVDASEVEAAATCALADALPGAAAPIALDAETSEGELSAGDLAATLDFVANALTR